MPIDWMKTMRQSLAYDPFVDYKKEPSTMAKKKTAKKATKKKAVTKPPAASNFIAIPTMSFDAAMKVFSVNHDKQSCGIGVNVPDYSGRLDALDELLNGAQLDIVCNVQPQKTKDIDDQSGKQDVMPGMGSAIKFVGVAKCGGFSRRAESVTFRLVFVDTAVDINKLVKLSGRSATLKLTRTGDAKVADEGDES